MPSRVIELLQCWNGGFVEGDPGVIWGAVPLSYVDYMEGTYKQAFKYLERSTREPKLICLRVLFDWMVALPGHSYSSF